MFSILQVLCQIKSLVSYAHDYIKEGSSYRAEGSGEARANFVIHRNQVDPEREEVYELHDRYLAYPQQCARAGIPFNARICDEMFLDYLVAADHAFGWGLAIRVGETRQDLYNPNRNINLLNGLAAVPLRRIVYQRDEKRAIRVRIVHEADERRAL